MTKYLINKLFPGQYIIWREGEIKKKFLTCRLGPMKSYMTKPMYYLHEYNSRTSSLQKPKNIISSWFLYAFNLGRDPDAIKFQHNLPLLPFVENSGRQWLVLLWCLLCVYLTLVLGIS